MIETALLANFYWPHSTFCDVQKEIFYLQSLKYLDGIKWQTMFSIFSKKLKKWSIIVEKLHKKIGRQLISPIFP